jgi:chloramphenicol-sensitive protein RarD
MTAAHYTTRGLAASLAAFVAWGIFPLYLYPLTGVPAIQFIAHRIVWSCVFLIALLLLRGELGTLTRPLTTAPLLARLVLTAFLISANWLVYVWAVSHGHVIDSSLGYFINPLVNVLLGVLVLGERLNRAQGTAVALAAVAVTYLTALAGHPPWIALTLAVSFSLYGLLRKTISVAALPGLATETLLLMPLAAAYLAWCQLHGVGALGAGARAVDALLLGSGLVTAVPLFLFAYGARALPYSTVGVLQYIAPTLQLLCAVFFFREGFAPARLAGFVLIWLALAIYAADGLWRARRARTAGAARAASA